MAEKIRFSDMESNEIREAANNDAFRAARRTDTITDPFKADDAMTALAPNWPLKLQSERGLYLVKRRGHRFTAYSYQQEACYAGDQAKIWNLIYGE